MRRGITLFSMLALALAVLVPHAARPSLQVNEPPVADVSESFVPVDIFIDCGAMPLAAWQVEVTPRAGNAGARAILVGIEGGQSGVYEKPAHYDPAALSPDGGGRVILAAFSTADADQIPSGRVRVARLHVMVEAAGVGGEGSKELKFDVSLHVAADREGRAIAGATASAAIVHSGTDASSGDRR